MAEKWSEKHYLEISCGYNKTDFVLSFRLSLHFVEEAKAALILRKLFTFRNSPANSTIIFHLMRSIASLHFLLYGKRFEESD